MQRNNTRVIIVLVILALAGLVAYLLSGNKGLRWNDSFRPDDKNPYGAYVLYELLKEVNGGDAFVEVKDTLANELELNGGVRTDNYLFIGRMAFLDSSDASQLLHFVAEGNNAFFLTDALSNRFLDSTLHTVYSPEMKLYWINQELSEEEKLLESNELSQEQYTEDTLSVIEQDTTAQEEYDYSEEDYYSEEDSGEEYDSDEYYEWDADEEDYYELPLSESYYDTVAVLSLRNSAVPDYPLMRRFEYKVTMNDFAYFTDSVYSVDGNHAEVLGSLNGSYPNFIRVRYGKGFIYVHSTPLVFTNYFMLSDTVNDYTREVMSHLGSGKVYWDEENRDYDFNAFTYNADERLPDEGPLEFILSERTLRTAWYLLLLGGMLYLIFGARRQQRIIPVKDNMDNTSIEYAEVISQLFMKQSDHKKLILLKMDLFKSHLRERFMIRLPQTKEEENDLFFQYVAQKTGVSADLVKTIFVRYEYLSVIDGVTTPEMLEFHQYIEDFYSHSK
jgi:hypothetical protein